MKKKIIINGLELDELEIDHEEDVRVLFDLRSEEVEKEHVLKVFAKGKARLYIVVVADKRTSFSLNTFYFLNNTANLIVSNNAFVLDSAKVRLHDKAEILHPIKEIHLRQQIYLYSLQAKGESIPELILKTDKVKAATHESSISDINEREKEYFASKGMDYKEVQKLLLEDYLSYFNQ